jgi:hypothetical protein
MVIGFFKPHVVTQKPKCRVDYGRDFARQILGLREHSALAGGKFPADLSPILTAEKLDQPDCVPKRQSAFFAGRR